MNSFKQTILECHPDFNGGDTSRVEDLSRVIAARRLEARRHCACGCGRELNEHQLQTRNRFASQMCYIRHRFYRNKLSAASATLIAMLLALTSCKTATPTVTAPATNSVALIMPPLPEVLTNKFTLTASREASGIAPVPPNLVEGLKLIYPPDASNYIWQLECSSNLTDWYILPPHYAGVPGTNTLTVYATNGMRFFRMIGNKP